MTREVFEIASEFIQMAQTEKSEMTNMRLQKLTYIAQGYCLAILGYPLYKDEIQAWKWGPVIPTLYNKYKDRGSMPIEESVCENSSSELKPVNGSPELKPEEREIIEYVWGHYKNLATKDLANLTHGEGTPWWDIWIGEGGKHDPISTDCIREHYEYLMDVGAP